MATEAKKQLFVPALFPNCKMKPETSTKSFSPPPPTAAAAAAARLHFCDVYPFGPFRPLCKYFRERERHCFNSGNATQFLQFPDCLNQCDQKKITKCL